MDNEHCVLRSECKYAITAAQIPLLRSRISALMRSDPHAGKEGSYHISSLYFDDNQNRCYYDNENGTSPREKFRIRIYDHDTRRIMLECKRKEHGKCCKQSCQITMEQAQMLIEGRPVPEVDRLPPLLRKMTVQQQMRRLMPAVIVEYDRVAYIFDHGNVRVTFDMNIAATKEVTEFFTGLGMRRPVMPSGQHLMELKYDEYLPGAVHSFLNLGQMRQITFSKYHLCRKRTI